MASVYNISDIKMIWASVGLAHNVYFPKNLKLQISLIKSCFKTIILLSDIEGISTIQPIFAALCIRGAYFLALW